MTGNSRFDKDLGYVPSIPLPFYGVSKWWKSLLGYRFLCQCGQDFRSERQYENHYALNHINPIEESDATGTEA